MDDILHVDIAEGLSGIMQQMKIWSVPNFH